MAKRIGPDVYQEDEDVSDVSRKLASVKPKAKFKGETFDDLPVEKTDAQFLQAMKAADQEMENPELMAEYNATQRYLDKELGTPTRARILDKIKALPQAKRQDFGASDEAGNALEAGYAPRSEEDIIARLANMSLNAQNSPLNQSQAVYPSEGMSPIQNAALATGLAGGVGAGAYGLHELLSKPEVRLGDGKLIVESPYYKQGLPGIIPDIIPPKQPTQINPELKYLSNTQNITDGAKQLNSINNKVRSPYVNPSEAPNYKMLANEVPDAVVKNQANKMFAKQLASTPEELSILKQLENLAFKAKNKAAPVVEKFVPKALKFGNTMFGGLTPDQTQEDAKRFNDEAIAKMEIIKRLKEQSQH